MNQNDPCAKCGGPIGVYSTLIVRQARIRYLRCRTCGFKPGKVILPLAHAPRRVFTTHSKTPMTARGATA